jgi:hypothetical protein
MLFDFQPTCRGTVDVPVAFDNRGRFDEAADSHCEYPTLASLQALGSIHPMNRAANGYQVESAKMRSQIGGTGLNERDVRAGSFTDLTGLPQHRGFRVDADETASQRMEIQRQETRPGAQIQDGPG